MSAFSWAIGGWLFLNLVTVVALLNRRYRPLVREKLFEWVIGERPFESLDHSKVGRSQLDVSGHAPVEPMKMIAHRDGGGSLRIWAVVAVIGTVVAASVIFVTTYPHSIAACASGCR